MGLIEVLRMYSCGLISEIIRRKGIQSSTRVKSTLERPANALLCISEHQKSNEIQLPYRKEEKQSTRTDSESWYNQNIWVNKILNKGPIASVNSMRDIALSFYTTNKKKKNLYFFPCLIKSIHIWLICSLVLVKSWQCCIHLFPHFNVDKSWPRFNKTKSNRFIQQDHN